MHSAIEMQVYDPVGLLECAFRSWDELRRQGEVPARVVPQSQNCQRAVASDVPAGAGGAGGGRDLP